MRINFPAALSQVPDQFFACFELPLRRLIAIEIADQTNAEGDVVQVIAVDMTAIDLPSPAITHFDFAIAGGGAIADDKMISEAILHTADVPVVIVEDAGAALSRSAVVDNDKLPTPAHDGSAVDF
jgi:hypothetical protein